LPLSSASSVISRKERVFGCLQEGQAHGEGEGKEFKEKGLGFLGLKRDLKGWFLVLVLPIVGFLFLFSFYGNGEMGAMGLVLNS